MRVQINQVHTFWNEWHYQLNKHWWNSSTQLHNHPLLSKLCRPTFWTIFANISNCD